MREIVDKLTCDVCGKIKITPYKYAGAELIYPRILIRTATPTSLANNDFYEVRPTQHLCGNCINAIRALMK